MPVRLPTLARRLAVACVLAGAVGAAPAQADDPLLSGYAGPGGGEQIVLGSKLIPPKNGSGSLRAGSSSGGSAGTTGASGATSGTGGVAATSAPTTSATAAGGAPATATGAATATGTPATGKPTTGRTTTSGTSATPSSSSAPGTGKSATPATAPGTSTSTTPASTRTPAVTAASGPSSAGPVPLSRQQVLLALLGLAALVACGWGTAHLVTTGAREPRPN